MGVKKAQIITQVFLEYALLTAYGAIAGVFIGAFATNLFVPLFRVTGDLGTALPPLLPIIAEEQIIPLAVIFTGMMIFLELILIASSPLPAAFCSLANGTSRLIK